MSLAEKPTHGGRPRLSLPGFRAAPQPASAPERPAPTVPYDPQGYEPYDPRRLSPTYWGRMRDELKGILGAAPPPVFEPRIPLPLRIGVHGDLLARCPSADPKALGRWLGRWTSTSQYRQAIIAGGPRFDLDGNAAGEITAEAQEIATNRRKP